MILTEQEILDLGFAKQPNLIIDNYTLDLSFNEFEFKSLSVTIEQGNQYVFIRQGSIEEPRHKDDVVTVFNGDSQGQLTLEYLKDLCEVLCFNNKIKK